MMADNFGIATAIAAERVAVVSYAQQYCGDLDERVRRGRMRAEDASILKRRIAAFAEGIAQGLHVEDASGE